MKTFTKGLDKDFYLLFLIMILNCGFLNYFIQNFPLKNSYCYQFKYLQDN